MPICRFLHSLSNRTGTAAQCGVYGCLAGAPGSEASCHARAALSVMAEQAGLPEAAGAPLLYSQLCTSLSSLDTTFRLSKVQKLLRPRLMPSPIHLTSSTLICASAPLQRPGYRCD